MNSNYLPWVVGLVVVLIAGYLLYSQYSAPGEMMPTASPAQRAASPATNPNMVTLPLETQSGLGQSGIATFSMNENGNTVVTLAMMGGSFPDPQPAHIHLGACPTPGAVKYPLTNVVNGASVTTLDASWEDVMESDEPLALNVHKSAAETSVYTACGNLP
jgi:hypothetical protein